MPLPSVGDEALQELLGAQLGAYQPILALLWAKWCGPSTEMLGYVEDLTGVMLVSLDIDDAPQTALRYGIQGTPTLILFGRDGSPRAFRVGVSKPDKLQEWLDAVKEPG